MGVSVASIKTTSKTWPLAATALRPGNRKVLLRASVFSHHLIRRALADPVSLRDMKIGPVFAPVFQHHQKLVFDAKRVGLASGRFLPAFGSKKQPHHVFKCASMNARKPPECSAFQLFDRIKSHRRPLGGNESSLR